MSEEREPETYRVAELVVIEGGRFGFFLNQIPPETVWLDYKDEILVDNRSNVPLDVKQSYNLVDEAGEPTFDGIVCEVKRASEPHRYVVKIYGLGDKVNG